MFDWEFVKYTKDGNTEFIDFKPLKWLGRLVSLAVSICSLFILLNCIGVIDASLMAIICIFVAGLTLGIFISALVIAIFWLVWRIIVTNATNGGCGCLLILALIVVLVVTLFVYWPF